MLAPSHTCPRLDGVEWACAVLCAWVVPCGQPGMRCGHSGCLRTYADPSTPPSASTAVVACRASATLRPSLCARRAQTAWDSRYAHSTSTAQHRQVQVQVQVHGLRCMSGSVEQLAGSHVTADGQQAASGAACSNRLAHSCSRPGGQLEGWCCHAPIHPTSPGRAAQRVMAWRTWAVFSGSGLAVDWPATSTSALHPETCRAPP